MKTKTVLTLFFVASLLPMLLNQYGGMRGVQEISGLLNLLNPVGILSVVLFVLGVWWPFKKQAMGKTLGALGTAGIVLAEIHTFLTWHSETVTGQLSLANSVRLAFPEFYIGLAASVAMVVFYLFSNRKTA